MYGIYHSKDLDGLCSGAIMKLKYPEITLIGYDYGEPIPDIPEGVDVIIADVCFQDAKGSIQLLFDFAETRNVTWIDHHISAITEFNAYYSIRPCPIQAHLDNTISACEGAWKALIGTELPYLVFLLGKYDTWRQQDEFYGETVTTWQTALEFQMGMRLKKNYSIDAIVEYFSPEGITTQDVLEAGKTILEYKGAFDADLCRRASFSANFEGLRFICMNTADAGSQIFESVYNEDEFDGMIPFHYNGRHWKFSMYTTKDIDLSVIAKAHGGGGHAKACGFQKENVKDVFPHIIPDVYYANVDQATSGLEEFDDDLPF